jgi:hypothetical protein
VQEIKNAHKMEKLYAELKFVKFQDPYKPITDKRPVKFKWEKLKSPNN